jgi:hypothetical protein
LHNQKAAFNRCISTTKFKAWHKIETMRRLGKLALVEENVKKAMSPKNIKLEIQNINGRWEEIQCDKLQD